MILLLSHVSFQNTNTFVSVTLFMSVFVASAVALSHQVVSVIKTEMS